MSSFAQSITVMGPLAGTSVATAATSTAAQDTGAYTVRIAAQCTAKCHIIFGESGVAAAQTSDFPMNADTPYVFDVNDGRRYFRVIRASADGTLIWAKVA